MKFKSFKKVYLFISGFILFFLFIVPLSGAEQSDNDITKQGFSLESMTTLEDAPQEIRVSSFDQAVTVVRQKLPSYDFKIPLTERFNAIFSLEKPFITDFAGKDIGKNYNALFGFQIVLQ
jgi:hypothetical protein